MENIIEQKITILLVDDHKLIRDGIRQFLEAESKYFVYDCSSAQSALHLMGKHKIDLVITDINMNGMDGISLCKELKHHWPDIKILVCSMLNDPLIVQQVLLEGANGYVTKESGKTEILRSINTVLGKDMYVSSEIAISLTRNHIKMNEHKNITTREREILVLIAQEFTNKEIADKLSISSRTVDAHRRNLIEKTGVRNTAGLVRYAISHNLFKLHNNSY